MTQYSPLFEMALAATLAKEGIYSNDPQDPGGETFLGISRGNNPDWQGWYWIDKCKPNGVFDPKMAANIKALDGMVKEFYYLLYWMAIQGDKIQGPVAVEMFDTAVNQGVGQMVRMFQEALNLLNNNQKFYPNIFVDGKIGENTIRSWSAYQALSRLPGRSTDLCNRVFIKVLTALQAEKYLNIARRNEEQEKWFFGWMANRV